MHKKPYAPQLCDDTVSNTKAQERVKIYPVYCNPG